MAPPVTEGSAPFHVPGADKPCATYYKVVGDIKSGTTRPLVVLHGGPGFAHDYLLPLADLAAPPYNVPVVFYDQFGGGRSTHLPEKNGDTGFWTEQLFEDEFFNLLTHLGIEEYDVLGHSWGGMLGARIAVHHPRGLRRLVLSDTLAKMEAWAESGLKLLRKLPQDIQVRSCPPLARGTRAERLVDWYRMWWRSTRRRARRTTQSTRRRL